MLKSKLNKDLLLIVVFGLLAAFTNLFRLPLFFEAEFIFGPFLVLLIAVFRGPLAALLASIIASIPLVYAWGSFWPTLTFGLEALFVGYIYSLKRSNVILIVIGYWMFIGMPISWYSISQYELFLDSHRTSILIKQLSNAILYAHITALLMYLPYVRRYLSKNNSVFAFSIKEQSSHIISSLLITVGIVFFFLGLNQNIKNSSEKFSLEHNNKHNILFFELSKMLNSKINAFDEYKHILTNVWDNSEKRQISLSAFNQRHPEFLTMIMTDEIGHLLHSSPPELVINVQRQGETINVADRDYFQEAINSDDVYVSPGFYGRGFGTSFIAAISAGVPKINEPGNYGVVEGTFAISSLNKIQQIIDNNSSNVSAIVVDQNNHIITSSTNLSLRVGDIFEFTEGVDKFYENDLVSLVNSNGSVESEVYFSTESNFDFDWKLITLQNESQFADVIEQSLIAFALSIVLLVLIAKILSWSISNSLSYSMHKLNQLIERRDNSSTEIAEFEENKLLPVEINNLYQEIKTSRLEIIKMNKELQDTVAERTEKLQKANTKLNTLARQDALTKLDNRYVFNESMELIWSDCQKSLLSMTMLIIDIDYFKKINDNYGHPVGDKVLIQFAAELQRFKSNVVKCVARIGGEEFCMLIEGLAHQDVISLANEIRLHIENYSFNIGADKHISLTVSGGIATIDTTKFTPTKLYQLADNALYEAKHSGRNQIKAAELN